MLRKTKADIGKFPHQLFVLVCVSEIVAAVYQIIICYFTAHEHWHRIAIGNPLKLSPDFPPLRTVHAAFTAHGAPSEMNFNGFKHNLHTSLQH